MAHETDILLGGEAFIDRIVREDGGFAEKIVSRVLSLDKAFAKLGDKEARAQHKIVRQAERLYLKAAEAAGNNAIQKMILSQVPELEEEVKLSRQDGAEAKKKQFDIIQATNPMWDDFHVGIRSSDDIRTWEEVLDLNDESEGQFVWGDFSREDAERALKENSITIYSSYPIKNGTFVSTSYVQAREYAGGRPNSKVYSKTVPLNEVAWINGDEGQYAAENIDVRFDLKENGDFDIDNYSEEDYNNYGWIRANNILTAGQMKNFEARFAKIKSKQLKVNRSKSGEYMIPVSDIYDYESEGIENVIVYAKGNMDSPVITRILEIDLDNETEIDAERRNVYDAERRGIQPKTGGIRRFYYPTDNGYRRYQQGKSQRVDKNHDELGLQRGRSGEAPSRVKGFHLNEDGTTTFYYTGGKEETVQLSLKDGANQQTSEDIDELMRSAGIEGDAAEIREDLAELYRKAENLAMDEDATSGKAFVERVANRIALNMARLGTVRDGETQETMAERLREEILSRSAFAEQETEAPQEAPKETPKDEPKPKKTGYTYDDVHGMMDAVKRGLKFETAGKKSPKGTIFPSALFYMQNYTKCKFCIIKGSKIGNLGTFEIPRGRFVPFSGL